MPSGPAAAVLRLARALRHLLRLVGLGGCARWFPPCPAEAAKNFLDNRREFIELRRVSHMDAEGPPNQLVAALAVESTVFPHSLFEPGCPLGCQPERQQEPRPAHLAHIGRVRNYLVLINPGINRKVFGKYYAQLHATSPCRAAIPQRVSGVSGNPFFYSTIACPLQRTATGSCLSSRFGGALCRPRLRTG